MDVLKLIPQLFFDLIARVVPGIVCLVLLTCLWPGLDWKGFLNTVSADQLDKENIFAFVFFVPLGVGFVIGHLIAPIGKWLRKITTRKEVAEPWRQYDWLRVHRPDAGGLAAKIRAEYTMHFSLAAAFLLGLLLALYGLLLATPEPAWWNPVVLFALMALSLYRGHETVDTFCGSVIHLYTVAQERVRPPDPPWTDEPPPSDTN